MRGIIIIIMAFAISSAGAQQSLRQEVETYVINPCYSNAYGSRNAANMKKMTRSAVNQVANNVIEHVRDLRLSSLSDRKRLYAAYVRECAQMLK